MDLNVLYISKNVHATTLKILTNFNSTMVASHLTNNTSSLFISKYYFVLGRPTIIYNVISFEFS